MVAVEYLADESLYAMRWDAVEPFEEVVLFMVAEELAVVTDECDRVSEGLGNTRLEGLGVGEACPFGFDVLLGDRPGVECRLVGLFGEVAFGGLGTRIGCQSAEGLAGVKSFRDIAGSHLEDLPDSWM